MDTEAIGSAQDPDGQPDATAPLGPVPRPGPDDQPGSGPPPGPPGDRRRPFLPGLRWPARLPRRRPERGVRQLVSPRLAADPRFPIWISRAAICLAGGVVFGVWLGWRLGLTIAVVIAVGDMILRSRTTTVIPAAVRVTRAQRQTSRRLAMLRPAGYLALNARRIAGTDSVVDHLVVGPAGVFAIDSELWDKRLPVRIADQVLYHGPINKAERLKHARWEAQQTATLVGAQLGQRIRVRPVMVIYGPNIPWIVSTLAGVDIFSGGRIGQYFRRQSKASVASQLDPDQIASIFAAAEKAMPPV